MISPDKIIMADPQTKAQMKDLRKIDSNAFKKALNISNSGGEHMKSKSSDTEEEKLVAEYLDSIGKLKNEYKKEKQEGFSGEFPPQNNGSEEDKYINELLNGLGILKA